MYVLCSHACEHIIVTPSIFFSSNSTPDTTTTLFLNFHLSLFVFPSFLFSVSLNLFVKMSFLGFSELYIGTEVTFTVPSLQKWVLEEKLTEDVQQMSKWELDGGGGPPFAVVKYICHSATDSDKKAFMRIYFQIPIAGTEYQSVEVRQRQAAPPRKHRELDALKGSKTTTVSRGPNSPRL